MTIFEYDAIKMSDRSKASGTINAQSEKEARELLREQNLMPIRITIVHSKSDTKNKKKNPLSELIQKLTGIGSKDRIAFTRNLSMMLKAGIPLTETLLYYENYAANPKFKKIVARMRQDINAGYAFSQALAKHKNVFDDVYVNVTKAGERSGELDQTMSRLTHLLVKAEQLKMKIITASVYPVLVIVILCLVLLIMFLVVLPTFTEIYKSMNVKLPLITQMMIGVSVALRGYWFISFPLLFGAVYAGVQFFKSPTGKTLVDDVSLKIPVLNDLIKHTQSAHLVSTLNVAFSAGLPITDALSLATNTLSNSQIKSAFQQVNVKIQTGQRLAASLAAPGYIPDLVMLMISTGEESGDLEHMLEASNEYLEEEINHRVGILTTMMEPLMLLVIGTVVGFVALAIYLPMFSIYDHMH